MDFDPMSYHCYDLESQLSYGSSIRSYVMLNLTYTDVDYLTRICRNLAHYEDESYAESEYSAPMVLIGLYISIASLFCILAMSLDLFSGFRNIKFWFPTRYFSLNAASITVITVAMKLPVDLTSQMPGIMDQIAKVGGLAFMCTIMCNFMPSLEFKYQATSKKALDDQDTQGNLIEKLRLVVKRYWIMAETGSPQFVMVSNPLSFASGIICAFSMLMYILIGLNHFVWARWSDFGSVYNWSIIVIVITQAIGIVVGSIAPISRCFTILSFKSFANKYTKYFLVFKVESYWTQKLCAWKESRINFLSSGRRSRALLHKLKNLILNFCIIFQKVIVISCKIIGLIPTVVILFAVYCSSCFTSVKAMLFFPTNTVIIDDHGNEDLSNYVLLLEDNTRLAKKTMKGISDCMNRMIKKAEKKQHNNLLKLLEKSVSFNGVEAFDNDQVQSLLSVEHVNSWTLPVISLTCIAIALPNIHYEMVENLFRSVGEGLLYAHLVEECLNMEPVYVNVRRATKSLWHEVEDNYSWLETTLKRSAYQRKTSKEIVTEFAHMAKETVNKFMTNTNGEEVVEKDILPPKIIAANSMHRIAETIIHTYYSNNLDIREEELFQRLSIMIADILAACFTNIPRVITLRCHEIIIEKREARVKAAVDLLGRTTHIIKKMETRVPNMDPDKMGFIDEWRLHLKQP